MAQILPYALLLRTSLRILEIWSAKSYDTRDGGNLTDTNRAWFIIWIEMLRNSVIILRLFLEYTIWRMNFSP